MIQELLEGMELGVVRELSCYFFTECSSSLNVGLWKLLQGLSSDSFSQIKPNSTWKKENRESTVKKKINQMLRVLIFKRNHHPRFNSPGDTAVNLRGSLYLSFLEITKRENTFCYMYSNTTLEGSGVSKLYGISLIYAWDLKCVRQHKERTLLFQPPLFKVCVDKLKSSLFTRGNSPFLT